MFPDKIQTPPTECSSGFVAAYSELSDGFLIRKGKQITKRLDLISFLSRDGFVVDPRSGTVGCLFDWTKREEHRTTVFNLTLRYHPVIIRIRRNHLTNPVRYVTFPTFI